MSGGIATSSRGCLFRRAWKAAISRPPRRSRSTRSRRLRVERPKARHCEEPKATQQSRAWVAALDCFAPLAMTDYARTDTKVLILFGDPHLQPVERVAERNLARQPRIFVAIARRIEQVVLVLAHRRDLIAVTRLDMDVACRAATDAAAQREQLVNTRGQDILHQIGRAPCRARVCRNV